MTKLSFKSNQVVIRKMQAKDFEQAFYACFTSFKEILPWLNEQGLYTILVEALHGSLQFCYVSTLQDQIIGGYFIADRDLPFEIAQQQGLENSRGVEGVALFLLPEYRGSGIGRQLREIPKTLGVDYIWGQHFKDLNNLENWTNYGREVVFEDKDVAITVMKLSA